MTPMQTLKNNFAKLSFNFFKFKEINLNKAQAKDIWIQNLDDEYALCFPNEETNQSHYVKKGVKSDFIKIFKAKIKNEKYSVAFHFSYIDVAEPTAQCSIKKGDDFFVTEPMTIVELKDKINTLNSLLDVNDVITTIEKTQATFFSHKPKVKP